MTTPTKAKAVTKSTAKASSKSTTKYIEAVGRRKTAIARVRATEATKNSFKVNDRSLESYFGTMELQSIVNSPLDRDGYVVKYAVTVKVVGGGTHAQAEAIRHGLSRIIVMEDAEQKAELKKLGFMRRDPRKKERKHFGLKKARKASQWSKR
ncbi:MAG: 30S ribosomal protein S9 [Parcubacteria group bacterium GW2011_GWA2_47_7]|nr:MAG: 30S ribosomal protein S9 [Parcubacteria group bacterium GW2011_GWA2_47_7]